MATEHKELSPELIRRLRLMDELYRRVEGMFDGKAVQGTGRRTHIALATLAANSKYCEAVRTLCGNHLAASTDPILRAMLEGRVQLEYILMEPGMTRAIAYYQKGNGSSLAHLKQLTAYLTQKGLDSLGKTSLNEFKDVESAMSLQSSELEDAWIAEQRGGDTPAKKGLPKLYEMVTMIDQHHSFSAGRSLTLTYLLLYSHLSSTTHQGSDGMANWLQRNDSGFHLNDNEDVERSALATSTAFAFFADTAELVCEEFGLEHSEFSRWVQEANKIMLPSPTP